MGRKVSRGFTRRKYRETELKTIRSLFDAGKTDREVGRAVGRTKNAMYALRARLDSGDIPKTVPDDTPYYSTPRVKDKKTVRRIAAAETHVTTKADSKVLVELILASNVSKQQKLRCIEALL